MRVEPGEGKAVTEGGWLAANQTHGLLEFLRGRASDRKLRLYGVACCRRVWPLIVDQRSQRAVDVAERYADGRATDAERGAAWGLARSVCRELSDLTRRDPVAGTLRYWPAHAAVDVSAKDIRKIARNLGNGLANAVGYQAAVHESAAGPLSSDTIRRGFDAEYRQQVATLHDLFGNPFRVVAGEPSWLTSTVVGLAEGIYADAAFDRLPILADALQDAGCEHPDILAHCRSGGPHARGCWVVDLLLGKE